jgi:hypothetical protein
LDCLVLAALGLLAILALLMFATCHVDWYAGELSD